MRGLVYNIRMMLRSNLTVSISLAKENIHLFILARNPLESFFLALFSSTFLIITRKFKTSKSCVYICSTSCSLPGTVNINQSMIFVNLSPHKNIVQVLCLFLFRERIESTQILKFPYFYRKWCNFLVKRIFWKKRIKIGSPTNAHADVTKINKLKMVFRTNRRSLKYAPKEFSKVNACARDPPWCYKNTQYSRQHRSVTHANPEWYVLTCSFDLQTTVSCYNFKLDKDLNSRWSQNWSLRSWPDTRIAVYPFTFHLPTKK